MQMKLFVLVCMTLIINHVDTSGICSCHCCRVQSCLPTFVGLFFVDDYCNSTTCNQNICFAYNGTLCPAFGSPGNATAICSSAYSIFNHFNLLLFFAIRIFQ